MRLTFKTLKIHNFLSFADEELDLSANRGMVLVCGKNCDVKESKNGSGKSSTFLALLYVLFGQLQNKIKNEHIVNRYVGSREMNVELNFLVGEKEYHILRGINKYGQSFVELQKLEDGEWTNITKSSIIETNSFIENEILNCDISIFLRTVFLSSDQNYNFFRLKPQSKKEFIERLFNITIFGDMYNMIHKDILQYDKIIYAKQNTLLSLNKNELNYKEKMDDFKENCSRKILELTEIIERLTTEYDEIRKVQIQNNSDKVRQCEEAANKLNDARIKIKSLMKEVESKLSKASRTKIKLETSRDSKQKSIDHYSGLLEQLCSTCKPIVSNYYDLTKYSAEIDELNKKIAELDKQISEFDTENSQYCEKLEKIEEKDRQISQKLDDLTHEFNEQRIKFTKYETQISNLSSELESVKKSKNPFEDLYESNHREIETESKELSEISERYNYLKYAETIVSQDTLKKFIIKDLVQLLNVKIKHYLSRLGSNYTCVFDENMDYEFITEGGTCEYDNFSSGERMRLMIAASFAFKDFMATRSNIVSNILILDEFIDSNIDKVAIENIMKILKEFTCTYNQSVYVISHRKEIDNSVFDSIIQVVKRDNISHITYLPNEKS